MQDVSLAGRTAANNGEGRGAWAARSTPVGIELTRDAIRGVPLREWAVSHPVRLDELLCVGIAVADIVAEAHRIGLVHGGLDLDHVVVSPAGAAVTGFSLPSEEPPWRLPPREVTGAHVAPEVSAGFLPSTKSDTYSLASTLRWLGRDVVLPEPLETLLVFCTTPVAEHRPGMATLAAELRRIERKLGIGPLSPDRLVADEAAFVDLTRRVRRRAARVLSAAGAVLVIGGGSLLGWRIAVRPSPVEPRVAAETAARGPLDVRLGVERFTVVPGAGGQVLVVVDPTVSGRFEPGVTLPGGPGARLVLLTEPLQAPWVPAPGTRAAVMTVTIDTARLSAASPVAAAIPPDVVPAPPAERLATRFEPREVEGSVQLDGTVDDTRLAFSAPSGTRVLGLALLDADDRVVSALPLAAFGRALPPDRMP